MSQIHKKVAIDLNIKAACIHLETPTEVVIIWKRGAKKIDTKAGTASPGEPIVTFNERF